MEEVNKLSDSNCGGNAAALHIWLKNAPAYGARYSGGARPKPGDRIDVFKQFVLDCYEHGKFRADTPYAPQTARAVSESSTASSAAPSTKSSRVVSPVPGVSPAPSVADFDFFATDAPPAAAPAQSIQQQQAVFDPFALGSNAAPPAAPVAAPSAPPSVQRPQQQPVKAAAIAPKSAALIDLLSDDNDVSIPQSNSAPFIAQFDAFGGSSVPAAAPLAMPSSQQQPQKKSSDHLLGLFDGMSFDNAPAVTNQGNGLNRGISPVPPMMQQPMMQQPMMQQPPMMKTGQPMMQQQYYGNSGGVSPMMMGGGGGMSPMTGGIGGGYSMGGQMGGMGARPNPMAYSTQNTYQRPQQQQQQPPAGSFDFLQDTMKKHLEGASNVSSAPQQPGSKPMNPFQY